jgi:prophage tail gpP-like protein
MWYLVSVVKGSKFYDSKSLIDNRMMISDTTDMAVTGYSTGTGSHRVEMRKGNEAFCLRDHAKADTKDELSDKFLERATALGAVRLGSA